MTIPAVVWPMVSRFSDLEVSVRESGPFQPLVVFLLCGKTGKEKKQFMLYGPWSPCNSE
jgi:hypothetical protein